MIFKVKDEHGFHQMYVPLFVSVINIQGFNGIFICKYVIIIWYNQF